ncbi:MAG: HD domain-containing protein [Deltaproteobacteria bacterium]|nr:HD domain-containing protein [Deltaproteobacteria bacterium]
MIDDATLERLRTVGLARAARNGPAHDDGHVRRVAALAERIAAAEGVRTDLAVAAALLHELVHVPKDRPERARAGNLAAAEAENLLLQHQVARDDVGTIVGAIRDHSFSKGVAPGSRVAAVLQDADRLDAMGAVGIARCFATTGELGRPLVHPEDPFCRAREPDDRRWAVDHFLRKLLRLEPRLHTATARGLARPRVAAMRAFLEALAAELPLPERSSGGVTAEAPRAAGSPGRGSKRPSKSAARRSRSR